MILTGKSQLGEHQTAEGAITFRTINPVTNTENDTVFYEATREEVSEAVRLARDAFDDFRNLPGTRRAEFLEAIGEEILALGPELIDLYCTESGLARGRAEGERARTIGQLNAFATMLREGSWVDAVINNPEGKPDIRRMLIPVGPVAVFGASNFPLAFSTAGGDTASALAAGCPVVVKSHPLHAGTGELVASAVIRAAKRTQMPNGVFSNLNSSGIEVGTWLVEHPAIKAVGFTGSYNAGMALYRLAAMREEPIPVYAEMGSVNPVLVLPSAIKDNVTVWAEQYATSIMAGTGQFCTSPGLIFGVESGSFMGFIEKLAEQLEAIPSGYMLHPGIKENYESKRKGILHYEGHKRITRELNPEGANVAEQTLLTIPGDAFLNNPGYQKEVFGPFAIVVICKDLAELQRALHSLEGQLTGTILCNDEKEFENYAGAIDTLTQRLGRIIMNGVPTGVEVCEAMTHGGPFPATTDAKYTSVGLKAVYRWVRPVSFQNYPNVLLPEALQDHNPLGIYRKINQSFHNHKI